MNRYAIHQNSFAAYEEMRGNAAAAACRSVEMKETVICPKPRRLGLLHTTLHDPSYPRPLRWHASHHQEVFDSKAGSELLDIILAKGGGCGSDQAVPPFFSGSPPSRVSNPLIQDARFVAEHSTPVPPHATPAPSPSSTRKGGCVRANFGNNPAVRVEGFDCLDRDRRNCSIPALA
ncbi:uncharacterized protein LOC125208392 isoform X2 [Salvia hispanica]|uniref:uncharacterized protein LOC125208392 isoform X2 n=1 Tax=Salvia hispanica TaxID=49212 RepID=UPI0020093FFB|nr:uncharacterized protein LOC125208392 isoform X2 [Salvia hispanica]